MSALVPRPILSVPSTHPLLLARAAISGMPAYPAALPSACRGPKSLELTQTEHMFLLLQSLYRNPACSQGIHQGLTSRCNDLLSSGYKQVFGAKLIVEPPHEHT
jgi:hypothetical protein